MGITMAGTRGFTEWLRQELTDRDWLPADLARKAGVPQSSVSAWLSMGATPRNESCMKIAEAFGIELDDVLRAAGHKPPAPTPRKPPAIISELSKRLEAMTADEQRRFALPAIRVAEALLREARERDQQ